MIELVNLTLQGFKSFETRQTFDLSEFGEGFYYIQGNNLIEPELESNGSGKSSLWDALCWVFFGQTLPKRFGLGTGLRGDTVETWADRKVNCFVECSFSFDGRVYTIRRSRSPNNLQILNPDNQFQTREQDDIEKLIGYNYSSFVYSIVISQFGAKFFDLPASEKLDLFSDIMNLQKWLDFSENAKIKFNELSEHIRNDENKLAKLQGQRQELKEQDYTKQIKEWQNEQDMKKQKFNETIRGNKVRLNTIKENRNKLMKVFNKVESGCKKAKAQNDKLDKRLEIIEKEKQEKARDTVLKKRELLSISKSIAEFDSIGVKCPTCYQKVGSNHKDKIELEFKLKQQKIDADIKDINAKLASINKRYDILEKELSEKEQEVNNYFDKLTDIEQEFNKLESNKTLYEQNINNANQSIKCLTSEANPYKELLSENKARLSSIRFSIRKHIVNVKETQNKAEIYKYWIKGFKEIRLYVISKTLRELELEINNNLHNLGLTDWSIQLSVDYETKSGKLKKGLNVMVESPANDKIVPFEAWSGGERQRVSLAGTLGLSDLIRQQLGEVDVEIIDEPTAWLDAGGVEDLLVLLQDRARNYGRKVFISDHRNFESAGIFSGKVIIEKNEKGSKIKTEN